MRKHRPARRALPRHTPKTWKNPAAARKGSPPNTNDLKTNKRRREHHALLRRCHLYRLAFSLRKLFLLPQSPKSSALAMVVGSTFAVLRQLNGFGLVLYRVHVRHIVTALDGNGNAVIFLRGFSTGAKRLRRPAQRGRFPNRCGLFSSGAGSAAGSSAGVPRRHFLRFRPHLRCF